MAPLHGYEYAEVLIEALRVLALSERKLLCTCSSQKVISFAEVGHVAGLLSLDMFSEMIDDLGRKKEKKEKRKER